MIQNRKMNMKEIEAFFFNVMILNFLFVLGTTLRLLLAGVKESTGCWRLSPSQLVQGKCLTLRAVAVGGFLKVRFK